MFSIGSNSIGRFTINLPYIRQISILGQLKPNKGAVHGYKRLGRGPSSGKGKTSGRGQKGQKARGKVKSWFEGGQTPIFKLFPKIGFTNVHSLKLNELNLEKISWFHDNGRLNLQPGEVLTIKKMKEIGLLTGTVKDGVKILANGKGTYNLPIKIEATRASQQAINAIEKSGGEFTARYFNKLGMRAHIHPDRFLQKYGRIPLQARPTKRKDIEYYSNPEKRGYLIKENHPLLDRIEEVKKMGKSALFKKNNKKSALEIQLENMSDTSSPKIGSSMIIDATNIKN